MSAQELRTDREKLLFKISAVVSGIVWLILLVTIVGILYGALIAAGALVAHCLFMAWVIGNGVRVGPRQLPEVFARVDAAARRLGLAQAPEAFVLQSGGILNAFATKILSRRFIILYSDLVEACGLESPEGRPTELDFVIAHEIGHIAAGHLALRIFLLPSRIVPLLGAAYSRACEYTCDRCGHEVVDDINVSSRALAILAAGPKAARRMNLDAFVDQRMETGRFWMAVYELNASHPFLTKRVAALRAWKGYGGAEPVGRNAWAYPLAPFFGVASGNPASAVGMVLVVMVIFGAYTATMVKKRQQALGNLSGMGQFDPSHFGARHRPAPSAQGDVDQDPAAAADEMRRQLEAAFKQK